MNHQGVELAVWLGIAALALVAGELNLWHSRRLLNQPQQNGHVQQTEQTANVAELSGSVAAP